MVASLAALIAATSALSASADEFKKSPAPRAKRAPAAAPAPAAQASNWSGGQFGAFGGDSSLAQNFTEPGSHLCPTVGLGLPCPETPFGFSGHPSTFTAGGFLGYRWQFGGFVAGVEGDAAWKKASTAAVLSDQTQVQAATPGTAVCPIGPPFVPPCTPGVVPIITPGTPAIFRNETFAGKISQGWDGSARLRLGVLVTPLLLAYGTAGVAIGDVCGSFAYAATLTSGDIARGAGKWCDVQVGYTVGGGFEAQVANGIKARLEYRYTDLGSFSKDVPLTATPAGGGACGGGYACTGNAHIDMEAAFHTIRLGLGVDF
jgi:outer membrane immunogenic protein